MAFWKFNACFCMCNIFLKVPENRPKQWNDFKITLSTVWKGSAAQQTLTLQAPRAPLTFSVWPMSGLCHVSILMKKSSFMYSF